MVVDRSFVARNDASRARLAEAAERLDDIMAARRLDGGWTVGALLVHLAFWDRMVAERWTHAQRNGLRTPVDLDQTTTNWLNDASLPVWRALSGGQIRSLVEEAATTVDELVAGLPDDHVEAVIAEGRERLVDRSRHRTEHLDTIAAALGR